MATRKFECNILINGTIAKVGGTAAQFLKADGSVDSSTYQIVGATHYVGTTLIANNRASATQTLTGINIDGNAGTANSSIKTDHIVSFDTRSTVSTPGSQTFPGLRLDFKANTTEGLSDGGTYFGSVIFRRYGSGTDWSGGGATQLGFTDNGNLWLRYGASTTWGTWRKLWHDGNLTNLNQLTTRNFSDLQTKPTTLAGYGITDAAPISGSANYIQNQNASAQSANMWINGIVKTVNPNVGWAGWIENSAVGGSGLVITASDDTGGIPLLVRKKDGTEFFKVSNTGAATFASTVTASNGTLIGGTLTSGYIPKATGANSMVNSLLFDNGTNVGIGTTSPSAKLHVKGSSNLIRLQDDGAYLEYYNTANTVRTGYIQMNSVSNARISVEIAQGLSIYTSASERMTITSSGNVGIGTTSPNLKLSVFGSNGAPASSGTTQNGVLRLTGGTGLYNVLDFGINETNDYSWIQSTRANNLSVYDKLALNPLGGNVGIGTTSPSSKLTVNSDLPIRLEANSNSSGYYTLLGNNYDYDKSFLINNKGDEIFTYTQQETLGLSLSNPRAGNIRLSTNGSERMRITSSGNIGIGTTSPQVNLSVKGAQNNTIAPANGVAKFTGNDAGIFIGTLAGTPNYGSWLQAMRENDGLVFPMYLNPNGGNVGIGTTFPSSKLDVAGTFNATGVATFASTVTAVGFFNTSDIRLKEVISKDGDLINFKWKDRRDDRIHIGYPAQEIRETYPDAVNEDAEGMLSVNYIEVLVAKVRALENRIKQLGYGI